MYDQHEADGSSDVILVITQALSSLVSKNGHAGPTLTLDANAIQQLLSAGKEVVMVIYNPLGWQANTFLQLPCSRASCK